MEVSSGRLDTSRRECGHVLAVRGSAGRVAPPITARGAPDRRARQPALNRVRRTLVHGSLLSFWGGMNTQRTLPYGTVQQVKDEVRRLLDGIGKDGGYIAAPAHSTPGDAKPENVAAMIEVLNDQ